MDSKSEWRQKNYRISNQQPKTIVQVPKIQRDESFKPQIPIQQQTQKVVGSSEVDKLKRENEQLKSELFAAKEQIKIIMEENKKMQQKYQALQHSMRSPSNEIMMALEMQRQMRHQQYYEFMQEAMMPQQQFQTDGMTYEQILELQEQVGHVSRGLTKEQIKKIPKKRAFYKQKDPCTICYNEIDKNDFIRELKCRHAYHSKCIKKWLQNEKKCPICQSEV